MSRHLTDVGDSNAPLNAEQFLDRAALVSLQREKLNRLVSALVSRNRFWSQKLAAAGITLASTVDFDAFQRLPLTTKHELCADQAASPPYGSLLTFPVQRYTRLHQTSGTTGAGLRWPDTPDSWQWFLNCWQIIYDAAGVIPDDRLFFAFSFGPFIGFWAAFEACGQRGNFRMAGGGMSSSARLRAILDLNFTCLLCTPTYALHLIETARAENLPLAHSNVRLLIVAGEPGGSVPEIRTALERGFGARVIDHTGMTEAGPLGVECAQNPGGVHLLESECIAELVEPNSDRFLWTAGDPPPYTDRHGELVLTTLGRLACPVLRYRTGDLVTLRADNCTCGRSFVRMIGGILGRSDDMLIIRGNNVYPSALEAAIRSVPGVAEFRVTVTDGPSLSAVDVEVEPITSDSPSDKLARDVEHAVQRRLFFRANVRVVPAGSLPRFEMKSRRVVRRRA